MQITKPERFDNRNRGGRRGLKHAFSRRIAMPFGARIGPTGVSARHHYLHEILLVALLRMAADGQWGGANRAG